MLTHPSPIQIQSFFPKPGLRILALLLLSLFIWQVNAATAWAASPDLQTAALTSTTSLTGTQTSPEPAACPVVESTWLDDYQSMLMNGIFQTAANMAGSIPSQTSFTERVNILLLGSDSRPGEKFGRTDTMILVTIDPVAKTAGMLSIPRDLWVNIPGYGEMRINQAHRTGGVEKYPGGGPALTVETISANLGVPINYYIVVDFASFEQIVDLLGGIELCVPETIDAATYYGYVPETINRAEYYSFVPVPAEQAVSTVSTSPDAPADEVTEQSGYQFLYIEAGLHTLDGATALTYARSRASVTADFARVQRQQAVLLAIEAKAMQAGMVLKLPELWETMGQTVETNLTLSEALQLAQLAYEIDPAHIQAAAISHEQTLGYRTAKGASVLLPRRVEIQALLEPMFGPTQPTALPTQAEIEAGLAQPNAIAQAGPAN